jgi:hypothetical protein
MSKLSLAQEFRLFINFVDNVNAAYIVSTLATLDANSAKRVQGSSKVGQERKSGGGDKYD